MTTELLGIHALIVFIMAMTTFYAYVLIIHTISHTNTVYKIQLLLFFTYESQPSVPPVEQKRNHLETDTLP